MKICIVTGSRADYGLLEWPIRTLKADPFFEVEVVKVWNFSFADAHEQIIEGTRPDILMLLGDRYEILACAAAAHLKRIPIAHLCGGDVTEGSYDLAMRDCISRLASLHFVSSTSAMARLSALGYTNIHLVGNPGLDYIRHAEWKQERPIKEPYVVVSYQAETANVFIDLSSVIHAVADRRVVCLMPNPDLGSDYIRGHLPEKWEKHEFLPHDEFLNLIYHCDEFIGNSSSMLYEAPELGVKVRMIGKRQRGRVIPWGDGYASERIAKILKYTHL